MRIRSLCSGRFSHPIGVAFLNTIATARCGCAVIPDCLSDQARVRVDQINKKNECRESYELVRDSRRQKDGTNQSWRTSSISASFFVCFPLSYSVPSSI